MSERSSVFLCFNFGQALLDKLQHSLTFVDVQIVTSSFNFSDTCIGELICVDIVRVLN